MRCYYYYYYYYTYCPASGIGRLGAGFRNGNTKVREKKMAKAGNQERATTEKEKSCLRY